MRAHDDQVALFGARDTRDRQRGIAVAKMHGLAGHIGGRAAASLILSRTVSAAARAFRSYSALRDDHVGHHDGQLARELRGPRRRDRDDGNPRLQCPGELDPAAGGALGRLRAVDGQEDVAVHAVPFALR